MAMLAIGDQTGLSLGRSDLVICLEAGPDPAVARQALSAVLATVAAARAVVLCGSPGVLAHVDSMPVERPGPDGGGAGPRIWSAAEDRPGDGLAAVVAAVAPADLVLLGAGCRLAPGWLEELSAAARSDGVIATASALDAALVDDHAEPGLVGAATALEPGGLARLAAPVGPCVYVRRSAIELVGMAPVSGSPAGAGFARRCQARGLAHALVGTVVVAGAPVAGIGSAADASTGQAVASARLRARLSRDELAVVIDARRLDGALDGTRVHLCELIAAVTATGAAEVTALLPARMAPDTRGRLERIDGLSEVTVDGAGRPPADLRADVVHRPHQVHAPADLALLAPLAPRFVLTQQDLIGYHARDHYASAADWRGYRELTALALASADRVLFFSAHARAEALAAELVEPARAEVIPIGTDHALGLDGTAAQAPTGTEALHPDSEVILCLGTDLRHKNREFALALAAQLRRAHAWAGTLVFAGPAVDLGSSRTAEAAMLAADPDLAGAVLELGEVADAERAWLLNRATLVLYPTVHEGFGLVPYEAAAHGVPCLWAPGTALSELLGDGAAQIVPWAPAAAAEAALALMRDPAARSANVAAVAAAGRKLNWSQTGRALVDAYRAACAGPPSPAGVIARSSGLMNGQVSPDGIRLVGPDGLLPADAERPLLAVLSRPRLAAPVLGALRHGYRLARSRADTG